MKFAGLREFSGSVLPELLQYVKTELVQNLRELVTGLSKLTFQDNFQSFEVSITIEALAEVAIRNALRGGAIPTRRIILRGDTYSGSVVDGDTEWGKDFVYLKNTHATQPATVRVLFLP